MTEILLLFRAPLGSPIRKLQKRSKLLLCFPLLLIRCPVASMHLIVRCSGQRYKIIQTPKAIRIFFCRHNVMDCKSIFDSSMFLCVWINARIESNNCISYLLPSGRVIQPPRFFWRCILPFIPTPTFFSCRHSFFTVRASFIYHHITSRHKKRAPAFRMPLHIV